MFLFGAGASIDGGLADTYSLTRNIYDHLCSSYDKSASKVFGLIIAKILARKVRDGGSPFERVNVEEVYDGLRKLAARHSDFLSDFVTGWDPAVGLLTSRLTERDVEKAFESLLNSASEDKWAGRGRIKIGAGGAREFMELLQKFSGSAPGDMSEIERSLLLALVKCLQHDDNRIGYFEKFIEIAKEYGGDVATLNYDLIAETSAEKLGFTYDYGLDKWNTQKVVDFKRSSPKNIRIIKLHGSLNWFARGDDIVIENNNNRWMLPNLVFGGASAKLRVDGPFLQLMHDFQARLLNCSILVIVGYSFKDEHLNSIIRRWTGTRRQAKLVIVDPQPTGSFAGAIGSPYVKSDDKRRKLTIDLNHMRMSAADAIGLLSDLLKAPIQLQPKEDRSGFLPHVDFRVIE